MLHLACGKSARMSIEPWKLREERWVYVYQAPLKGFYELRIENDHKAGEGYDIWLCALHRLNKCILKSP
jgi:hypothetical protein